jgi:hypothetical protein
MTRNISVSALERICLGIPWNFIFYEIVRSTDFKSSHHMLLAFIALYKFTSNCPHIYLSLLHLHPEILGHLLHTCYDWFLFTNPIVLTFPAPSSTTMQHKFEILATVTSFYNSNCSTFIVLWKFTIRPCIKSKSVHSLDWRCTKWLSRAKAVNGEDVMNVWLWKKHKARCVHYLVENKISVGSQTYPLQCKATHKHPSVLPNLQQNKIKSE